MVLVLQIDESLTAPAPAPCGAASIQATSCEIKSRDTVRSDDAGSELIASQSANAARLMELLGLSEDELCRVLDVDPLTLLSGQLEQSYQLPILLAQLDDAAERAGPEVLGRWVRARGPHGRPIDALVSRDFKAFEDALAELAERGFVLRGGGAESR